RSTLNVSGLPQTRAGEDVDSAPIFFPAGAALKTSTRRYNFVAFNAGRGGNAPRGINTWKEYPVGSGWARVSARSMLGFPCGSITSGIPPNHLSISSNAGV